MPSAHVPDFLFLGFQGWLAALLMDIFFLCICHTFSELLAGLYRLLRHFVSFEWLCFSLMLILVLKGQSYFLVLGEVGAVREYPKYTNKGIIIIAYLKLPALTGFGLWQVPQCTCVRTHTPNPPLLWTLPWNSLMRIFLWMKVWLREVTKGEIFIFSKLNRVH